MLKKFLKDKRGESLVESLAAILIFTMASIIMFSMVTTAVRINAAARDREAEVQTQLVAAESAETASGSGTVTMTITTGGAPKQVANYEVDVYGGAAGSGVLHSYFTKP